MHGVHVARRNRLVACKVLVLAGAWLLALLPATAGEGKVVGKAEYEKIHYRRPKPGKPGVTVAGLDVNNPKKTAIHGAKAELVAEGGAVLASAYTKADGSYELPYKVAKKTNVSVRVSAVGKHVVVKHFDDGKDKDKEVIHAVATESFPIDSGAVKRDVPLATDKAGQAGAFNILEAIRRADVVLEKADQAFVKKLPTITVSWTAGVYPDGTSRFYPGRDLAYIKGNRDFTPPEKLSAAHRKENPDGLEGDCDEFDDYVIIHEYGHFVMYHAMGYTGDEQDDSPGGNHQLGNKLDPRLAWNEAWCNFFACAVLEDSRYIDTLRDEKGNDVGGGHDAEQNSANNDEPGIWSERTVESILWDMFAPPKAGEVHLNLGFPGIWQATRGLQGRFNVSLVDFCEVLVDRRPELAPQVNKLLESRKIKYKTGAPLGDDTPYHLPLGGERKGTVDSFIKANYHHFDKTAFYILKIDKKMQVKIDLEIVDSDRPKNADLDLLLFDRRNGGDLREWDHLKRKGYKSKVDASAKGQSESIVQTLEPGAYSIEVRSWYLRQKPDGRPDYYQLNKAEYRLKASVVAGK